MRCRPAVRGGVAGVILLAAASLALAGCGSGHHSGVTGCAGMPAAVASSAPVAPPRPAAATAWTQPDGDLQSTRDVARAITAANVSQLGVAWCVPIESTGSARAAGASDGYATTPVVVTGVVYTQDLQSNVMAIRLATGAVLWRHHYDSPNGGPDGVTVADGTVYAATNSAAVALSAATGRQLWSRTLVRDSHEGIDMAPGYHDGSVYVSTVPTSVADGGTYPGGGKAVLWALNAATGAPEWSWDEVGNLWGNTSINSGGGLWYPPSFDAQGNLYLGVANPGPIGETGWPAGYPWGTSRPGPDLYTDSVVKLSPTGRLLWYYQLTPHDLYDWGLQDPPMLTTVHGRQVVIDGGKAGIAIELDARTGTLLWKRPIGVHSGHDNDGLLTERQRPPRPFRCPPSSTSSPACSAASSPSWPATGRLSSPP